MKTKVDVISGFLGAGKTTLIKRLIADADPEERLVILQNEHGIVEIENSELEGIGASLEGINSGCICCDMTGNFIQSIESIVEWTHPDRILLEPSGVGRLSDILNILKNACSQHVKVTGVVTVVDVCKFSLYLRNYRGFFDDQLKYAKCILLSKTEKKNSEEIERIIRQIYELNPDAVVLSSPLDKFSLGYMKECIRYQEAL